jgi:hypothetical protein
MKAVILAGAAALLASCVYTSGAGNATFTVNRILEIDSNIAATANAASAPDKPTSAPESKK